MLKKLNEKSLKLAAKMQTARWKAEGGVSLPVIIGIVIGLVFIVAIVSLMTLGWDKIKTLWNQLMGVTFS